MGSEQLASILIALAKQYGPEIVREAWRAFEAHQQSEIDRAADTARAHVHDSVLAKLRVDNGDGHQ